MSQTGSSVFRKASLELQEDVQEMHAVRKGNRIDSGPWEEGACHLGPWDLRFMCELLLGQHSANGNTFLSSTREEGDPQARPSRLYCKMWDLLSGEGI